MNDWIDKLKNFPDLVQEEPRYGYLVVVAILFVWLVGIICGWKWTYSRPGSTGGNFWMDLLGPATFRFWLGVILAIAIGIALYMFSVTGK